MLAEYAIKMTLDNGDSFVIGMVLGAVVVFVLERIMDYGEKK